MGSMNAHLGWVAFLAAAALRGGILVCLNVQILYENFGRTWRARLLLYSDRFSLGFERGWAQSIPMAKFGRPERPHKRMPPPTLTFSPRKKAPANWAKRWGRQSWRFTRSKTVGKRWKQVLLVFNSIFPFWPVRPAFRRGERKVFALQPKKTLYKLLAIILPLVAFFSLKTPLVDL